MLENYTAYIINIFREISDFDTELASIHVCFRQNRVFGTVKSTNIPTKTVSGKPLPKSSSGVVQKPLKSPENTKSLTDSAVNPTTENAKKAVIKENRAKPRKKSVCCQENRGVVAATEPKTPVKSPVLAKPRLSGSTTPFYSAGKCSKCRFDRLETSSYWLSQIKLAENVGKHSVSAAFFRLALDSKAEVQFFPPCCFVCFSYRIIYYLVVLFSVILLLYFFFHTCFVMPYWS